MSLKFSDERAAQILVSLLKQHGIKYIVSSPGATNITFVATAMHDSWFEIYSSVDERSAAYMACGLASETGQPVVLSCTGATASRNYMPGLTEAYYRKLPVLAVTASQDYDRIGHLSAQLIDRSVLPNDVARRSFTVKAVRTIDDEWADEIAVNGAILELSRHGGGPVHLNFQTTYSPNYSVTEIRPARKIERVYHTSQKWPKLPVDGRIGIIITSHSPMSTDVVDEIDTFCENHNAVVFADHTSGYDGRYKVAMSLPYSQVRDSKASSKLGLLIHIGEVSGDYPTIGAIKADKVWRVSEDGELRDFFKKLTAVFEMSPGQFFSYYNNHSKANKTGMLFFKQCREEYDRALSLISELPFSNVWIAYESAHRFPPCSVVHLGILNTLRSWNYFSFPKGVRTDCNVGGFGIDGIMSTLIGASLSHKAKLYFAILGDLAFFYDMNAAGNRHIGPNVRIMIINNGRGTEFRNYDHPGAAFGDESDKYIAAAGHFGNKSEKLVRHFAEDLGFEYMVASEKRGFISKLDRFLTPEITDRPMVFEVFTDFKDESDAQYIIKHLVSDANGTVKDLAKSMLGSKGKKLLKDLLGK